MRLDLQFTLSPQLAAFAKTLEPQWAAYADALPPLPEFDPDAGPGDIDSYGGRELFMLERLIFFARRHAAHWDSFLACFDAQEEFESDQWVRERNAWRHRRGLAPQYMEAGDL